MSIDERAEISLTSGRWRCGAFSQRIREFLRGFARFRQRKDRSGKNIFPTVQVFCKDEGRIIRFRYRENHLRNNPATERSKSYVWINSTCNNIDRNHSSRLRHRFCHCLRYGKLRNRKPREGKSTKGENAMVPFITGIMCAGIAISSLFM